MHSLQRIRPRLGRAGAVFSAGATRWKRKTSFEAGTLQALLGMDVNEASTQASTSQTQDASFSEKLRSSFEALTRNQSNTDSLLDTLKTVANDLTDGQPGTKKARRKKKKTKQVSFNEQVNFSLPPKESAKYDGTSELRLEDWSVDRLAPPHQDRPRPTTSSSSPYSHRHSSVLYKRRVEGLLEDSKTSTILTDLDPISEQHPVATLAHGLDRVLFNPGVHWLQDPRSHVYNFTPWLEKIPNVNDFAFERLVGFIKSSKDDDLWTLAKREGRGFVGSTSSLTKILSHIYFLLSGDKEVDISTLSQAFRGEPTTFTPGQRMPASVVLNYRDGVYAIDSDSDSPEDTDRNILTWMGTLLEKFLTSSPQDFRQLLRPNPPETNLSPKREAYRYAKSERFVMRSQLDCHDRRLPGTGVFDIKTRAALPIRLDILNYEENSGYLIRNLHGPLESFEKEYYDLIRSAFLKYSFQARIGNMDGVLVAYHNTARLFGFQYVPLEEMDERLFGSADAGPRVFQKCLSLLEIVADEAIKAYPEQSIRCMFETLQGSGKMNIWIQPLYAEATADAEIKQLVVTTTNYLSELQSRGSAAVNAPKDADWSIYWTISTLANSKAEIRRDFEAAKDRQFRDFLLPSGVEKEHLAEFWEKMNFRKATMSSAGLTDSSAPDATSSDPDTGGDQPAPVVSVNPDQFRKPGKNIKFLRSVARAGREHTEMVQEQRRGMPRIVWGEQVPWVDETEVSPSPLPVGLQDGVGDVEADVPGLEVASGTLEDPEVLEVPKIHAVGPEPDEYNTEDALQQEEDGDGGLLATQPVPQTLAETAAQPSIDTQSPPSEEVNGNASKEEMNEGTLDTVLPEGTSAPTPNPHSVSSSASDIPQLG